MPPADGRYSSSAPPLTTVRRFLLAAQATPLEVQNYPNRHALLMSTELYVKLPLLRCWIAIAAGQHVADAHASGPWAYSADPDPGISQHDGLKPIPALKDPADINR